MAVTQHKCPNCGAGVEFNQAHTRCVYCQTPLSRQNGQPSVQPSGQHTPPSGSSTGNRRDKQGKGTPLFFMVLWVGSLLFIASEMATGSQPEMALVPVGMAIFGGYKMLKSRQKKRQRS